jgi:uncharacterized protein DUF4214
MTTRVEWAFGVLVAGKFPLGALNGLVAQASQENTQATNNPLATTFAWPGSTDYNSAQVKNYPTLDDGYSATIATWRNGLYPLAIAALEAGDSAAYVQAIAIEPWGTWRDPSVAAGVLAAVETSPEAYGSVEINTTFPVENEEIAMTPGMWVRLLYELCLGRTVDPSGYQTYVPELTAGTLTPEQLMVDLQESAEGQAYRAKLTAVGPRGLF